MNKLTLAALTLGTAIGLATAAHATSETMTFEGLQDLEPIGNFYNGGTGGLGSGPGPNFGVSWSSDSLAVISSAAGGSGNTGNLPSGSTAAFFLTGPGDTMNVAAGFTTGFSFFYAAAETGSVTVWSGLNGTGAELGSFALGVTSNPYFVWVPDGISFAGTAHSAVFGVPGEANFIAFDNVTIGSASPGGVPEPSTWAMLVVGFAGLGFLGYRAKRKKIPLIA